MPRTHFYLPPTRMLSLLLLLSLLQTPRLVRAVSFYSVNGYTTDRFIFSFPTTEATDFVIVNDVLTTFLEFTLPSVANISELGRAQLCLYNSLEVAYALQDPGVSMYIGVINHELNSSCNTDNNTYLFPMADNCCDYFLPDGLAEVS